MKLQRFLTAGLLCVGLIPLLTGCGKQVELKNRLIVQAVGVDWEEDNFVVTVQIFRPEEGGQQGAFNVSKTNSKFYQEKGRTITEALAEIEETTGKRIFLGSNQLLVVGEKAAAQRMAEAMSFFNANHEVKPRTRVVVSMGTATDLVSVETSQGIVPADAIEKSLHIAAENGGALEATLMDVVASYQTDYGTVGVPYLSRGKDFEGKDTLVYQGTALFVGGEMVGSLEETETRGAAWLGRGMRASSLLLEDGEGSRYALSAKPQRARFHCKIEEDRPVFQIGLTVYCSVPEALGGRRTGAAQEEVDKIEELARRQITGQISSAMIRCLKEEQADLFQFSEYLEKYEYDWWEEHREQWPALLAETQVTLSLKVYVQGLGLGNKGSAQQ